MIKCVLSGLLLSLQLNSQVRISRQDLHLHHQHPKNMPSTGSSDAKTSSNCWSNFSEWYSLFSEDYRNWSSIVPSQEVAEPLTLQLCGCYNINLSDLDCRYLLIVNSRSQTLSHVASKSSTFKPEGHCYFRQMGWEEEARSRMLLVPLR
ncbi:hypothetical protein C8Q75DRAFT_354221 [Abortiporus biennis]|nr:hypothetical protein C8Q75DRAFT_354221 [Abortiporus biennis]